MFIDLECPVSGVGVDGLEIVHRPPPPGVAPAGPPLLFIHGAFTAAWCWEVHYLPYFASLGYDCYAVSLRGHGYSAQGPTWRAATLNDFVDDTVAAVETLAEPPLLIGHSMGGLVVDLALRRGMVAAGAVLLAAVPPTGLTSPAVQLAFNEPGLAWQMALLPGAGRATDIDLARRLLFSQAPPDDVLLNYTGKLQSESQVALFELCLPRWPLWGGIGAPVAVLGARDDRVIPGWMVELTAWIHGVAPRWIEGTGHATMLEPSWSCGAEALADSLAALTVRGAA